MMFYIRYGMIGIINTIIGYGCIFSFMFIGLGPRLSNFCGFAVALVVSYFLNRKFNFKSQKDVKKEMPAFVAVVSCSYLVNLLILHILISEYQVNPYFSQVVSSTAYTLLSVAALKALVFQDSVKKASESSTDAESESKT